MTLEEEKARHEGWEACRRAAMGLCLAEVDRQGAAMCRARNLEINRRIASHGEDVAAALLEDIKRMPYPEKP